jgi:CheY-like chemotaxis protein
MREMPPIIDTKSLSTKKLLVIDDIPFSRLLPGMVLRPFGVHVVELGSVEAAIQSLSQTAFDIVLLDLSMPEVDGFEAIRRLQTSQHLGHAKVYAYTAYADETDPQKLKSAGFHGVLVKPIKNQELLQIFSQDDGLTNNKQPPQFGA